MLNKERLQVTEITTYVRRSLNNLGNTVYTGRTQPTIDFFLPNHLVQLPFMCLHGHSVQMSGSCTAAVGPLRKKRKTRLKLKCIISCMFVAVLKIIHIHVYQQINKLSIHEGHV